MNRKLIYEFFPPPAPRSHANTYRFSLFSTPLLSRWTRPLNQIMEWPTQKSNIGIIQRTENLINNDPCKMKWWNFWIFLFEYSHSQLKFSPYGLFKIFELVLNVICSIFLFQPAHSSVPLDNITRAISHNILAITTHVNPSLVDDTSATAAEPDTMPGSEADMLQHVVFLASSTEVSSNEGATPGSPKREVHRMLNLNLVWLENYAPT